MLSLPDALAANASTPRAGRVFRFHKTARRIARSFEPAVAAAWMQALARFKGGISEQALRTALLSKDLAAAEAAIDASRFGQMMRDLEDPLARTATATGMASAKTLTAGGYTLGFNATHPNVILYARDQSATLVRRVTETTREAIRTVIALGAQEGLTIETQARAIREVVGLPPSWAASPYHLEQELRAGNAAAATNRRLSAVDKQQIRSRIAAGTVDDKFIQECRARYTASLINRRALNIARTETIAAANWGQQESWRQGVSGGHIPRGARRFWLATPSASLCAHCGVIPGWNPKGVGIEEPFSTPFGPRMLPPAHPNCLLPGTLMQGAFVAGLRAEYAGDVVELQTAHGRQLAVTPNHPVLTSMGFVPAGLLREGMQLLGYRDGIDSGASLVPAIDTGQPPTAVEEVFRALAEMVGSLRRAPRGVAAEDLHGDARFTQGQVDVVGADGELLLDRVPQCAQGGSDLVLVPPTMEETKISRAGPYEFDWQEIMGTAAGGMRGSGLALAKVGVVRARLLPFGQLRCGSGAQLHPSAAQTIFDDTPCTSESLANDARRLASAIARDDFFDVGRHQRHPVTVRWSDVDRWARGQPEFNPPGAHEIPSDVQLARDISERFAGVIELDEVCAIHRYSWRGHVYDLQSVAGWNIANNIIISNCRCGIGLAMPILGPAARRRAAARRAVAKKRGGLGRLLGTPAQTAPVMPTLPLVENIPLPSFERSVAGLEKKHIHLDRARMDRMRASWTDAEPGARYQQTVAVVNKAATEVTNAGFTVPELNLRLVPRGSLPNGEMGWFEYGIPGGDALTFPVATFDELRSGLNVMVRRQWLATRSIKGTAQHELGHALHSQFLRRALAGDSGTWMTTLGENWGKVARAIGGVDDVEMAAEMARIAREVSGYARICPAEFVAETFTGLMQGERYSTPVMQLYRDLHGPISKRWRRLFADTASRKASAAERLLRRTRVGVKKASVEGVPTVGSVEEAMPKVWSSLTPAEQELVKGVQIEFVKKGSLVSVRGKASHGVWRASERKIILERGGNWRTQAHELGHAIDDLMGGVSTDADVAASIRAGLREDSWYTNLIRRAYVDEKQIREVTADLFVSIRTKGQVRELIGVKEMRARFPRAWEIMEKRLAALPPPAPGAAAFDLPAVGGRLKMALPPDARRARAIATHKPATRVKQQLGDRQPRILADALNGDVTKDNAPMDITLTDDAGRVVGVEVKTFCDQVRGRVTMHPESMARKRTWARKNKGRMATVVVDARADFGFADLYSGTRYYVRKGIGGYNIDTMEGFDTLEDAADYIRAGFKRAKPRAPVAYDRPAAGKAVEGPAADRVLAKTARKVKLSRAQREATEFYQGASSGYFDVNTSLRDPTQFKHLDKTAARKKLVAETVRQLDSAMEAAVPLPQDVTTWRSITDLQGFFGRRARGWTRDQVAKATEKLLGSEITDQGFVSVTTARKQAEKWAGGPLEFNTALVRIRVPAGSRGLYLPTLNPKFQSQIIVQKELLLPRGARLRVTKVTLDRGAMFDEWRGKTLVGRGRSVRATIDMEYVPPRIIARDLPGTGGATTVVAPPAAPPGPLTVESFAKKAAARELQSTDDAIEELKRLVPDVDVTAVKMNSAEAAAQSECAAFFDPVTRKVHLGQEVSEQLTAFLQGSRTSSSVDAVRSLVHEYYHSTSPLWRARAEIGHNAWAFIEEGLVESRARATLLQFMAPGESRLPWAIGSYDTEVQAIEWVVKTFGRKVIDDLWALEKSADRNRLLNTKVQEWLQKVLPKQGLTVRETHAIVTELDNEAWRILENRGQVRILRLKGKELRDYFEEYHGVKPPPPVQGKGRVRAYDKPLRLDDDEKKMVKRYQDGAYAMINRALRAGWRPKVPILDTVIEKAPRLKKPTVLWRGLNGTKGLTLRPGTTFTDKGYVSTSGVMQRAAEFMLGAGCQSKHPVMIRILAKKGQRGFWMKDAIGRTEEAEFVLPRGSRFRVKRSQVMDRDRFTREVGRVRWFYSIAHEVTVLDVFVL